jgi:hypothetical protein
MFVNESNNEYFISIKALVFFYIIINSWLPYQKLCLINKAFMITIKVKNLKADIKPTLKLRLYWILLLQQNPCLRCYADQNIQSVLD